MKSLYSFLAAVFLFTLAPSGQAAVSLSINFFHENLEPYGDWREVGDYGYCWQPRDVDPDWRPYSDGRWVYTDAGWTWDSNEPYGWAVYHYGRWTRVARVGWVWVPGREWGPAWVSWRRSPGYVGWAPLPPEARFTRTVGFNGRVDADYDIGPTYYSFVTVRNFGAPRLRAVIVEPRENITIIRETTNITRITYVNNVVYNQGPQYEVISRESAQPVQRLKLERREEFNAAPGEARNEELRTRVEGDALRVAAPNFDAKPATKPSKVAARVEKVEVDRGWKDAGPAEEVTKLRKKIKSEPATVAEVPPSQAEKPADGVATEPENPERTKGKRPKQSEPVAPAAPGRVEGMPPSPENAGTNEQPEGKGKPDRPFKPRPQAEPKAPANAESAPEAVKPKKGSKQAKPDTSNVRPEAPVPGVVPPAGVPSEAPKKGKKQVIENPRQPADAPSQPREPSAKSKKAKSVEPSNVAPPLPVQPPQEKKAGKSKSAPPQPEPRPIERSAPQPAGPSPKKGKAAPAPSAPAAAQPAGLEPSKEQSKGKGKGGKKGKDE